VRLVVCVMIVTLVAISVWYWRRHNLSPDYGRFVDGAWCGDPEYCKSAEIDSMILVLDRPKDSKIHGHLLVTKDVCNQSLDLEVTEVSACGDGIYELTCDVDFGDVSLFDTKDVKFRFCLTTGQLRIYKGGELLGLLYRDNVISAQTYD